MTTKNFVVKNGLTTGNIILDASSSNITANVVVANLSVPASANLGNIGNVKIVGGSTGQILSTDGTGNLSWATTYSNSNAAAYLPTYTGNISANYFIGNGSLLTNLTGANVTGQVANALVAGTVYIAAQPNITSVGTLTSLSVTGNISAGNINAASAIYATTIYGNVVGNISGTLSVPGNNKDVLFNDNGAAGASDSFTFDKANVTLTLAGNLTTNNANLGNAAGANYFVGSGALLTNINGSNVSGNVSQAVHAYYSDVANSVTGANVSGNVSQAVHAYYSDVANSVTGGNVSGNVSQAVHAYYSDVANSVTGSNVSGQVSNALIAGTVYTAAQPNITSVGTLTSLTVSGDTTITGNLTVTGNYEYANVTSFRVKDPIIEQGGNPNGTALASNDGYDRGQLLHYYSSAPIDAFMGWDNSNAEFAFGSNVSVASEVVTFNTFGNIRAGYFIGNGSQLTGLPASYSNANVAAYLPTYNGNILVGNANVTGTLTAGNLVSGSGAGGTISGANSITSNYFIGNGVLLSGLVGANVSGNVSQAVHAYYADVANSVTGSNVTGQVGNALVAGTVYTAAQPNITSVGTLTSLSVTGNVSGNYFVGNGSTLTNITGGNVTGQVSNALIAGTVYTNAQPNITSVGTLTSLSVTGNVTANYHIGNGSTLTNITGANVTGQVSNALIAGTVYTAAQPNITSVGTLTSLSVTGNVSANYYTGNGSQLTNINGSNVIGQVANALVAGTVYTNAQPNITSVGTLTSLNVTGNITGNYHIGNGSTLSNITGANVTGQVSNALVSGTVYTNAQPNITSVGTLTSLTVNGISSLGAVSNVKITGGSSNQLLQTDGTGNVSWVTPTGTTITVDNFTGNGVQANFTLSTTPASKAYTMVALAGTIQPRSVYTVTGTTLSFSSAPPDTAPIEVTTFSSVMGFGNTDMTINVLNANTVTANTLSGNIISSNSNLTVNTLTANSVINGGSGTPTLQSNTSIVLSAATVVRVSTSPLQFYTCTTTVRDAIAASNGYVIYNTTTSKLQVYANGVWADLN